MQIKVKSHGLGFVPCLLFVYFILCTGWGVRTEGPAGYNYNQSIPTYFQDLPAIRTTCRTIGAFFSLFKDGRKDAKIPDERVRLTK